LFIIFFIKQFNNKNAELFTLTYGSIVTQLIKDYEDYNEVNRQLEKMYVFTSTCKLKIINIYMYIYIIFGKIINMKRIKEQKLIIRINYFFLLTNYYYIYFIKNTIFYISKGYYEEISL